MNHRHQNYRGEKKRKEKIKSIMKISTIVIQIDFSILSIEEEEKVFVRDRTRIIDKYQSNIHSPTKPMRKEKNTFI